MKRLVLLLICVAVLAATNSVANAADGVWGRVELASHGHGGGHGHYGHGWQGPPVHHGWHGSFHYAPPAVVVPAPYYAPVYDYHYYRPHYPASIYYHGRDFGIHLGF